MTGEGYKASFRGPGCVLFLDLGAVCKNAVRYTFIRCPLYVGVYVKLQYKVTPKI